MRVLIATITAGGGHLAAAAALDESWRAFRPADSVERVDLIKFFSPLHRKIHADGYVQLVERAPELWGMMFKTTDNPKAARRLTRLKRAFPGNSRHRFERFVKEFNPDVVLCTHYIPLEILGHMRIKNTRRDRHSAARASRRAAGRTGKIDDDEIVRLINANFDLRPGAIIRDLNLRRPIYRATASYGHFGRTPEDGLFTWEKTDRAADLKKLAARA